MTSAYASSRLMRAITTSRTSGAQAATNRARSGPTLTQVPPGELEILGDAAVEIEARVEGGKADGLECIAKLVKSFVVEGGCRQFRLPPIARRHVRSPGANL